MAASALLLVVIAIPGYDWFQTLPEGIKPTFVGRTRCIECHQDQAEKWRGSHHDLAMDLATESTVLGDFDNATIDHFGVRSRMYREHDRFMVQTEGPDGQLHDYQVQYVLGVEPLQQYMVELESRPAEDSQGIGQLQVLRITWDTEGKRWYFLNPPDVHEKIQPGDDLHWTGIASRWNNSCADCHSTNLQKNYDLQTGLYHTSFSEIDVSCEACHGPGSTHVQLAESKSLFWDRRYGYGLARLKGEDPTTEIQSCAPCHSHRRVIHPGFEPGADFYDHFSNAPLLPSLYHADGQIMEEVYVYGSFIQSKMYHKSIRCTDCHDPHTAQLKQNGNQTCTSCHQHPQAKYDAFSHHHHTAKTGTSCVECHMPETTYMEVDPRRDHSIRIPRPDLSLQLGTPNACSRCHLDRATLPEERKQELHLRQYNDWVRAAREGHQDVKDELAKLDRWSADHARTWYGDAGEEPPRFAAALAAARNRSPTADEQLRTVLAGRNYPAVARATAVTWLDPLLSNENAQAVLEATRDRSPQVREVAATMLSGFSREAETPYRELLKYAVPLLSDPSRNVRIASVQTVATIPQQMLNSEERVAFDNAFTELRSGLAVNNDRAAIYVSLGNIYQLLGDMQSAQKSFRRAIFVEPGFTGARSNLAELLDQQIQASMRRMQAVTVAEAQQLEQQLSPLRIEIVQLRRAELVNLARDAGNAPRIADVQYRYGLGLYRNGEYQAAEMYLKLTVELEPRSVLYLATIARFLQDQGRYKEALPFAERMAEVDPNRDDVLKELQQLLRQQP